jgi:hypothetical protein
VERGVNVPTEADVQALIDLYAPSAGVAGRLLELARDIRAVHRPVVMARPKARPSLFQARPARIEASSEHVGTFSNTVVPGLLQTEAYIRELIAPRQLEPGEADDFVYDRRAVSYGTVDATAILTEPRDVEKYAVRFDTLASSAVYGREARALLADVAERYRKS